MDGHIGRFMSRRVTFGCPFMLRSTINMSNSLVEILVRRRLWQLALVGCPKKSLEENLVSEGKKVIVDNLIRKHAVYMIGKVANKID